MNSEIQHLYVNMPGHTPCFDTITQALEALDASDRAAGFPGTPAEEKSFPAPASGLAPAVLHIGRGSYREKLVVTRPGLTFQGEGDSRGDVILIYGDCAMDIMPEGDKRGTFRTASVRIDTHDFTARHLTIANDAGSGANVGQALALYVDGDRNYFHDCALRGHQDTLFTAPLPEQEMVAGGFKGPGDGKPRILGRHCYRDCYIEGTVDFIFGGAIAYFENCELHSLIREDKKPAAPGNRVTCGYVTAASTPKGEPFGYVFRNCRLTGDCPSDSVFLGRPWREYARTVFLSCEMGAHIRREGWNDWKKEHSHFYYGEYGSYGPGADSRDRADFSRLLTDGEAAAYTIENVLRGWAP